MENPKHSFTIKDGVLTQYRGPGGDVVLPEGITRIAYAAFRGCTALRRVVVLGDRLSGPDSAFSAGARPLPCILARAGSPAERFAKKCGYPFEAID